MNDPRRYIKSMDVVRTLRDSFENALAEVVQCARRMNSAEGETPVVLMGDMRVDPLHKPKIQVPGCRSMPET